MTVAQMTKKNISLAEKFSNYLMKNPAKAKSIKAMASIIVIPRNDEKLEEENKKMLKRMDARKIVYVAKESDKGWIIREHKRKK